jgi:hypothetical protein
MGYAKATGPPGAIITYIEAYWKVGSDPKGTRAMLLKSLSLFKDKKAKLSSRKVA